MLACHTSATTTLCLIPHWSGNGMSGVMRWPADHNLRTETQQWRWQGGKSSYLCHVLPQSSVTW
ncbi:hypothetical protein E2C01_025100 [Portunus trituberculatus]|uniref:Uncharacterized protein n=1 Tax=Portunus trituberculatus TaxID=210409 RepID=A0A5B7EFN0_PORTR|nr:hypothetical protein [Portunus trituberculatus]